MFRNTTLFLSLATCLLTLDESSGALSERFAVVGYGTVSCGGWTKERAEHSASAYVYEGWVEGYLTGFNQYSGIMTNNITKGTDIDGISADIDNYCATHPLGTIAQAAEHVASDLLGDGPRKLLESEIRKSEKALADSKSAPK
jgi:hypothetical protein